MVTEPTPEPDLPVLPTVDEVPVTAETTAPAGQEMAETTTTVEAPPRICKQCGETCRAEANWCEACGFDLDAQPIAPKYPCISCQAAADEITDDGYCQVCGTKQPAPEDHVVADHGWFAVVSDKGKVHRTNEDAGAVRARATGVALVVCDGVSSTNEAQHAAQSASKMIADMLEKPIFGNAEQTLVEAARAAQDEIIRVAPAGDGEPSSCTMVAAVAKIDGANAELRLGWLGDSRAYWINGDEAIQLTRDHSWAIEQMDLGQLPVEEIEADKRSSSITRWLGEDSHDVTPQQVAKQVELPGILLLCSDGLWNYAETPPEIHALVHDGADDEQPLAMAERLVAFANEQGGRDNITVALATLRPQSLSPNPSITPDQE